MQFERIYDEGLAQASYLVGCPDSGELTVVDPTRDIDTYLDWADEHDYTIESVTETHIHADYLSGARELAEATGATLFVSGETEEGWHYSGLEKLETEYVELSDGDTFKVGNVVLEALHTPGHTPEHMTFLVTDGASTEDPMMALTGDFVFVGDLGRPDLLEKAAGEADTARRWAEVLYDSVKDVFLKLPDDVQVWPGHGAGSACGKALGAIPSSTVGYEAKNSWWAPYFEDDDKAGFVDAVLEEQPESPYYFKNMKLMNRDGPQLLEGVPATAELSPRKFRRLLDDNAYVLDLRGKEEFAREHISGAINISSVQAVSTYGGWMVEYGEPIVLHGSPEQVEEATRRLIRIGLDNIEGYIPRLERFAPAEKLASVPVINARDAKKLVEDGYDVLDVRSASEHNEEAIQGATNIHYGQLRKRTGELPEDKESAFVVHCGTGQRASVALSALESAGYRNLALFPGGVEAWDKSE
jgi:hydroxyacylglutathione hydrolase